MLTNKGIKKERNIKYKYKYKIAGEERRSIYTFLGHINRNKSSLFNDM